MVTLPQTWTLLSTLLGEDYSADKGYIIHIDNVTKEQAELPILRATLQSTTPEETYRGSEYPGYLDIQTDPGDSLWIKAGLTGFSGSVEVYEYTPENAGE